MSELKETPTPVDEKKTGEEPEVKTEENSVENPEEKSVEKPEEKPKDNSKELAEENKEEVVDEVTKTRKPPGKSQKKRRKALKISLIVFGILVGFFVLGTAAVNCFMIFTEGRHIKDLDKWKEDAREGIDCIMVLGCSVHSDGTPSKMLADRLDAVVELYQVSPQKIIVSGDHVGPYYNEVAVMKDYLVEKGIPSEDIFMDHYGLSTYESVYRAYHKFGVQRITIVTQKYHIYRALYLANAMGMEADGYASKDVLYEGQASRDFREFFARDKDFLTGIFRPKVDTPMDPVSLSENGDITNVRDND